MAKIVIIGNSAAGFSCCDTLVKNSQGHEITVISEEGLIAYNRNLLLGYLAASVAEKDLFLCGDSYYNDNKVKFLKNSKVVLLEPKRQRLTFKDNTKINYDYLVVASGSKPGLLGIPGNTKDGVFIFYTLEDARKIKQRMMIADTVGIIGEAMVCMELAQAPVLKDKEIKIISKGKPDSFVPSEKQEWLDGPHTAEIIGEGVELRAIKLDNGKVLGVSLAIFVLPQSAATEFLKGNDIQSENGYILVDEKMETNIENILACGSACRKNNTQGLVKTWDDAVKDGILAATNLIQTCERGNNLCQQTS